MNNKLVGVILAVMVSVIVIAGVMVPIVTDATARSDTFTNEGIFYVSDLPAGETITYGWDNGILTVNGVELDIADFISAYGGQISVLFTENMSLRYISGESVMGFKGAISANSVTFINMTVSNGTITGNYTSAGEEKTINTTYTEFTGIVPESSEIMANAPVYVLGDSEFSTTGFVNASGLGRFFVINVKGSIDGDVSISVYDQITGAAISDVTVSNIQKDVTAISGYENLYEFNKITFTLSDGTNTHNVTFSLMVFPEKVIAERTEYMDPAAAGILNVAPIIVIVALLSMVAAILIRSRY